ncbi:hypothetical protein HDU96_009425 [Phlyctochytrium bullatum]|nr:hypothetical protein HDU96_009425 [Phlyctochytrium bullatum]
MQAPSSSEIIDLDSDAPVRQSSQSSSIPDVDPIVIADDEVGEGAANMSIDTTLILVLEMFPNADEVWVKTKLQAYENDAEALISAILEGEESVQARVLAAMTDSKRKREEEIVPSVDERANVKRFKEDNERTNIKEDNERTNISSPYKRLCVKQLYEDYPNIPNAFIAAQADALKHDYLDIRRYLDTIILEPPEKLPFQYVTGRKRKSKGKKVARPSDEEIAAEKQLQEQIAHYKDNVSRLIEEEQFECGCCFVETLYSKLCQEESLRTAKLEDLETCPFCPYAAIISEPKETLRVFECQNPECLKASCRLCRKVSHIPKRCEEIKQDEVLSARHQVEEAMTEALLRTKIKQYEHFQTDPNGKSQPGKTCPLWDDAVKRNKEEVEAAAKAAVKAVAEGRPGELDEAQLEKSLEPILAQTQKKAEKKGKRRQSHNFRY